MNKPETDLTIWHSLFTLFVVMPLAITLSTFTWLRLFAWYVEPLVHLHPNVWWSLGFGSITFYYQYNPYAKHETSTRETYVSNTVAPFIKYGIALGAGWFCHLYATMTPS
jgi:hypothetical protein